MPAFVRYQSECRASYTISVGRTYFSKTNLSKSLWDIFRYHGEQKGINNGELEYALGKSMPSRCRDAVNEFRGHLVVFPAALPAPLRATSTVPRVSAFSADE
jgi:hypothetical protein